MQCASVKFVKHVWGKSFEHVKILV
uniref:Uncharacterized protein n=1 Tax=Anguilla anguilla TaxID=7936 RepID=A0A0E9W8R5_ANGAN